jgi:hypothetical protein
MKETPVTQKPPLYKTTMVLILICFGILVIALVVGLWTLSDIVKQDTAKTGLNTAEKMALSGSVQVALGMVMGFVSVIIGLMLTWSGTTAAFELHGKSGGLGELTLKSAAPGLVFFIGGALLTGASLHKTLVFEQPTWSSKQPIAAPTDRKDQKVTPNPLPPLNKVEPEVKKGQV